MSTHHIGECSRGNWTLEVTDAESGLPVTLNSWSRRLYGRDNSPDNTWFYTDEYTGQVSLAVLDDTVNGVAGGRNTLNTAAVSGDTSVNLLTGAASIGGTTLAIRHPSGIRNYRRWQRYAYRRSGGCSAWWWPGQ